MKRFFPILSVAFVLLLAACDGNRVYQQVYDFDENGWHMDSIPSFTFEIEDAAPKNLILHLRNSIAYEWQNVYLNYSLEDSTGREISAELINIALFDTKTGEPLGQGSSIYQHAENILENHILTPGTYTFKVTQYMRELELKEVMSVGIRVENVGE